MKQSKIINPFVKLSTVVMLAVLLMAGCSESPVTSSYDEPQTQLLTRSDAFKSAMQTASSEYYMEQVISAADGGTLNLLDVTLEIPAGAVPNDTVFSISIPDIDVFYNEFGTSGLVFDKPVKVTMSYRGADLSNILEPTIRIAYYNELTGVFEDVEGQIDMVNKTITAELYHFSAYGLISDMRPAGN